MCLCVAVQSFLYCARRLRPVVCVFPYQGNVAKLKICNIVETTYLCSDTLLRVWLLVMVVPERIISGIKEMDLYVVRVPLSQVWFRVRQIYLPLCPSCADRVPPAACTSHPHGPVSVVCW